MPSLAARFKRSKKPPERETSVLVSREVLCSAGFSIGGRVIAAVSADDVLCPDDTETRTNKTADIPVRLRELGRGVIAG